MVTGEEYREELERALKALGARPRSLLASTSESRAGGSEADLVLMIEGQPMPVEFRSVVRAPDAPVAAKQVGEGGLIISDRVASGARDVFRDEAVNWLDRRGHLRLVVGQWFIDADLPGENQSPLDTTRNPWSPLGRDVAVNLLVHPQEIPSPVVIARQVGARSHSRVSEILTELRRRNFIDSNSGLPLVPELFWELAEVWSPRWLPLARTPDLHPGRFRLAGSIGASWHGAPVAVGKNWPPELYTHDQQTLRSAVRQFGQAADVTAPAARVAACPSRYAWTLESPGGTDFPVAAQIVVALDLAQDVRGREVLEGWDPGAGGRVW